MGKEKYIAYVGTYTHGSSIGIHLYDVDVEEGTLSERKVVPVNNSSYVVKSKNGKYLYSIADEGVAVFAIKPDGDLEPINKVDIDGMRGCYLSVDDDGKYLFVGGYHDGKITAVHTHKDGRLGKIFDGVFHKGIGSVAERNFRPHVSCVLPTPEGKYVCAVDNGIDQVKIYRINTMRNRLELVDVLRCKRESGPREIVFSKDGNYAYILFELINKVGVFKYKDNGKTPEFELIQTIETLSDELDPLHDCAAAITISPDGKHLFTSTAGDNSVAMFSINQEDGTLV
ncbi:MAG: beta-propeller fold lactonase family protein, partial [Oliverpabstia sp.]|nr:beta-propeller fold lactonase family protein [Oliverpabstia sp.]